MKKYIFLIIIFVIGVNINSFSTIKKKNIKTTKNSATQIPEAAKVVIKFFNGYVEALEINNDQNYIENSDLITDKFKAEYLSELLYNYQSEVPECVPIICGNDIPRGYKFVSYDENKGIVLIRGIGLESRGKVKVKKVNGKWLVDSYSGY